MNIEVECKLCGATLSARWSFSHRASDPTCEVSPCDACTQEARQEAVEQYKGAIS